MWLCANVARRRGMQDISHEGLTPAGALVPLFLATSLNAFLRIRCVGCSVCGNGLCEKPETCGVCATDCGPCATLQSSPAATCVDPSVVALTFDAGPSTV